MIAETRRTSGDHKSTKSLGTELRMQVRRLASSTKVPCQSDSERQQSSATRDIECLVVCLVVITCHRVLH
jgi:hypothetical protein